MGAGACPMFWMYMFFLLLFLHPLYICLSVQLSWIHVYLQIVSCPCGNEFSIFDAMEGPFKERKSPHQRPSDVQSSAVSVFHCYRCPCCCGSVLPAGSRVWSHLMGSGIAWRCPGAFSEKRQSLAVISIVMLTYLRLSYTRRRRRWDYMDAFKEMICKQKCTFLIALNK